MLLPYCKSTSSQLISFSRTVTIATPPTDKSTPLKPIYEEDEQSQCSLHRFLLDNDDLDISHEFTSTFESPAAFRPATKVDFTSSIGMFLTLAAAQQASAIQSTNPCGGEKRSLFDESFDLKEVICEGMN